MLSHFITFMLLLFVNINVVLCFSVSHTVAYYHYQYVDWWKCVCVFSCRNTGAVCALFLHLSVGCPSMMTTEAPLVPIVLIDVPQYCDGRLPVLFWTRNMLITTTVHTTEKGNYFADVLRLRFESVVSSGNVGNLSFILKCACKYAMYLKEKAVKIMRLSWVNVWNHNQFFHEEFSWTLDESLLITNKLVVPYKNIKCQVQPLRFKICTELQLCTFG